MSSKAPVTAPEPKQPAPPPVSPLEQYVETNARTLVTGFLVFVAVAIAIAAFSYFSHRSAEAAAIEAAQVKTAEDCDLVVQHHPGTTAAGDALLFKAKLLWDQNKKDQSVATLRDFVAKYTSHPFLAQGTLGLATRLEAMGNKNEIAEAKSLYEKLSKEQGKSDIGTLAQMRLADMLWNEGKADEAKKIYESLPSRMTGSPFFQHNSDRLQWLAAGLPTKEVEPPPPPPEFLKAPTPGAPSAPKPRPFDPSPYGKLMDSIDRAVPDFKSMPRPAAIRPNIKPVAVPATPKPGMVTPGGAIAIPGPGKVVPGAAVSAPVKVPAPSAPSIKFQPATPPAPKDPTPAPISVPPAAPKPAAPATPAPAPAPPSAAATPAPATPAPAPAPEKK